MTNDNEFQATANANRPGGAGAAAGATGTEGTRTTDPVTGTANSTIPTTTGNTAATGSRQHEKATDKVKEGAKKGADTVKEKAGEVRDSLKHSAANVRDRSRERYGRAREYSSRKLHERGGGTRAASDSIESNPLAVLGLGLFAGMALGLLLPRTRQENRAMGSYRDNLLEQASAAARAAREAGEQEFRGLAEQAKTQARELGEQAVDAAKSAGQAGLKETDLKS